jgi:ribosomal protein S18 acetylase RimI-like enzyme
VLGVYSTEQATIGLYERLGYVRERELESYRVAG